MGEGPVAGAAYAVGFWICTMRALRIGLADPTVTINNMALVAGVLYGLPTLTPERSTGWAWAELMSACAQQSAAESAQLPMKEN